MSGIVTEIIDRIFPPLFPDNEHRLTCSRCWKFIGSYELWSIHNDQIMHSRCFVTWSLEQRVEPVAPVNLEEPPYK